MMPPRGPMPPPMMPPPVPGRTPVSPLMSSLTAIGMVVGMVVGVPLAVVVVIALWTPAWTFSAALSGAIETAGNWIGYGVLACGFGGALLLLRRLAIAGTHAANRSRKERIVKLQSGQPIDVLDVSPLARLTAERALQAHYGVQLAEARREHPALHALHYVNQVRSDGAALPSPAAPLDVGPLPLAEWLDWADEQPHILLGGKTKAGKTTTATAILARRLAAGEPVFVIDPHSSDWLGLPTAGRTSRSGELIAALAAIAALYTARMEQREQHKAATGRELSHDHFGRLTVLIDEANDNAEQIPDVWKAFTKRLASGGRKVGISLLLLAQSPLVEDLKISGGMRGNFARIALDELTVQAMIDGVRDKERRDALNAAVADQDWIAAATIGKLVYLLDRDGIRDILEPPDARALVWDGWDYAAGRAAQPGLPGANAAPAEPRGTQTLVVAGAPLPTEIGGVALGYMIAKMVDRGLPLGKIGDVLASLVCRADPTANRRAVAEEIARRATLFVELGNATEIAAGLDRDDLIAMCKSIGAGTRIAYAIWGGNSNQFYKHAGTPTGAEK